MHFFHLTCTEYTKQDITTSPVSIARPTVGPSTQSTLSIPDKGSSGKNEQHTSDPALGFRSLTESMQRPKDGFCAWWAFGGTLSVVFMVVM